MKKDLITRYKYSIVDCINGSNSEQECLKSLALERFSGLQIDAYKCSFEIKKQLMEYLENCLMDAGVQDDYANVPKFYWQLLMYEGVMAYKDGFWMEIHPNGYNNDWKERKLKFEGAMINRGSDKYMSHEYIIKNYLIDLTYQGRVQYSGIKLFGNNGLLGELLVEKYMEDAIEMLRADKMGFKPMLIYDFLKALIKSKNNMSLNALASCENIFKDGSLLKTAIDTKDEEIILWLMKNQLINMLKIASNGSDYEIEAVDYAERRGLSARTMEALKIIKERRVLTEKYGKAGEASGRLKVSVL